MTHKQLVKARIESLIEQIEEQYKIYGVHDAKVKDLIIQGE